MISLEFVCVYGLIIHTGTRKPRVDYCRGLINIFKYSHTDKNNYLQKTNTEEDTSTWVNNTSSNMEIIQE